MKNLLCVGIILFISLSAAGQMKKVKCEPCGSLTGIIYGSDNLISENISIVLWQGTPKYTTVTDCAGTFNFSDLPPGRYDIVAQAANHKKHVMTGTIISPERLTFVCLNMKPDTGSKDYFVEAYRVPLWDKYYGGHHKLFSNATIDCPKAHQRTKVEE